MAGPDDSSQCLSGKEMSTPSHEDLLAAVRKEEHPDFGIARIRNTLKEERGWELSEKRVKKAMADLQQDPCSSAHVASGENAPGEESAVSEAPAKLFANCVVEEPSARSYASVTLLENVGQVEGSKAAMFGGEHYDGKKNLFYNQLYLYDLLLNSWSRQNFPEGNTPSARSAHQACICRDSLFVFGGESSSPNGSKFKLYNDLWRLDLSAHSTGKWQKISEDKDAPGPRSGARMTAIEGKIFIYGGMGDDKYFQDLHVFDVDQKKWISRTVQILQKKNNSPTPGPRSGYVMWNDKEDGIFIYGGTRARGRNDTETLEDLWRLDASSYTWERVTDAKGQHPGQRSGLAVTLVGEAKRDAVLFGGVSDQVAPQGSKPTSSFHADFFCFNMDARQWSIPKAERTSQGNPAEEPKPMGRRNAQIVHSKLGQIFMFGGVREEKSENNKEKEVTLDDVWSIPVGLSSEEKDRLALGSWKRLQRGNFSSDAWHDSDSEADSDSDNEN
ncbi:hypothetical protein GUITHDRAFT_138748 [Guillardia theta CCMP2712]|uniref:Uncharacterized protein n=1 Tax=Guillardia theta (strain CCMP2712) TaxID=905079 RepID=L1JC98_GUITC|nr:hypothetical protein GUITHDRAFT_138748 [Guillardia theta CCMP2712]EKX45927.1 hypothetical protein GUITHDRAFT_138748 [Guillardia theta CCMP2712]|eukprot:XP_005832907.1 hypothetical protein GUITHDRAFT_138748 [Guillardia theta CCMP2712]